MCWRAGHRGPDIDQCVRSSAEYRRSQNFQWQPDYSGWGTPGRNEASSSSRMHVHRNW
jgi:hypothetical protein